eukprot:12063257-Alexandrium_andersonii.AAC.1
MEQHKCSSAEDCRNLLPNVFRRFPQVSAGSCGFLQFPAWSLPGGLRLSHPQTPPALACALEAL